MSVTMSPAAHQERRNQALNLALMYHRQQGMSEQGQNDVNSVEDVITTAHKFEKYVTEGKTTEPQIIHVRVTEHRCACGWEGDSYSTHSRDVRNQLQS